MEDYLQAMEVFYNTWTKYNLKTKYKKCELCKTKRVFSTKPGILQISCSASCKKQVTINLAEYTYYPETKKEVTDFLQSYIDPDNFKDVLHVSKDTQELKDKVSTMNELLDKSKKAYVKQNNLKDKLSMVKKTHKERIQYKKEQCIILHKLQGTDLAKDKRRELMKDYLAIHEQCKSGYMKMYESNTKLNDFLLVTEGTTTQTYNDDELDEKKPKKSKKPKKPKKPTKELRDISGGEKICEALATTKIPKSERDENRQKIYDETIGKITGELTPDNLTDKLTNELFVEMYLLYDKYFFKNKVKDWITENGCSLVICWGDKCSRKVYGVTYPPVKSKGGTQHIKIDLNAKSFIKLVKKFLDNDDSNIEWTPGVECDDLLSCIQLTFEHELVHGLMFCFCNCCKS